MDNIIIRVRGYLKNFFNAGHERSVRAKRNIFFSFLIKGLSIAISLVLVPLTIHYVNPTRYGIWLTLSSIIGWLSFFDIGFGNGLRNKLAEAIAKGETDLARVYISTTYAILSIIVGIILLIFFCLNPFLSWAGILNAPSEMSEELRLLALIVFVFFCIQFVLQLLTTIMTANQEPAKASFFSFLGSLGSLVIIFILTRTTAGNLVYLGSAFSVTPVVILLLSSLWYFKYEYRKFAPAIRYVKFGYARDLMTLGIKFFVLQIAAIVIYQTSNIIIAQLFGPAQVTPYNIAYKYFSVVPMFMGIILMPFWSAFTEAWIKKDIEWIKNTMKKLRIIWFLLTIATLIMLVFSDLIYRLWVGKEIVVPISLSISIAAYVIIYSWNGIFINFLNGVGIIKLQLYSGIWGMVLNIPLAIYLGRTLGIIGVVLPTVFLGAINMIWSSIQYKKIINFTAKGIWAK
jgi:O-antigen/teichoic acid export membrane protein